MKKNIIYSIIIATVLLAACQKEEIESNRALPVKIFAESSWIVEGGGGETRAIKTTFEPGDHIKLNDGTNNYLYGHNGKEIRPLADSLNMEKGKSTTITAEVVYNTAAGDMLNDEMEAIAKTDGPNPTIVPITDRNGQLAWAMTLVFEHKYAAIDLKMLDKNGIELSPVTWVKIEMESKIITLPTGTLLEGVIAPTEKIKKITMNNTNANSPNADYEATFESPKLEAGHRYPVTVMMNKVTP